MTTPLNDGVGDATQPCFIFTRESIAVQASSKLPTLSSSQLNANTLRESNISAYLCSNSEWHVFTRGVPGGTDA